MPRDGGGDAARGVTFYRAAVGLFAGIFIGLGVALIAVSVARAAPFGVVIGVLFVGLGAGRLYLLRRR